MRVMILKDLPIIANYKEKMVWFLSFTKLLGTDIDIWTKEEL